MGDAQSSRTCSLAPDSPPIFQKTDGAYSSLNSSLSSVKLEHQARHYAANSESDTSIITLPEGFEVIYVLGSGVCRSLRAPDYSESGRPSQYGRSREIDEKAAVLGVIYKRKGGSEQRGGIGGDDCTTLFLCCLRASG